MTCCEEVPILSHELPALADPGQPRSPALWEPSHTQSVSQGPGRGHEDLCSCFPAEVPGTSFFLESGVFFQMEGVPKPSNFRGFGGEPPLMCPSIFGTELDLWDWAPGQAKERG